MASRICCLDEETPQNHRPERDRIGWWLASELTIYEKLVLRIPERLLSEARLP
jgi:hypothetical protein